MAMGSPIPSPISSKSPKCCPFLFALWLSILLYMSVCSSSANEAVSLQLSNNQREYEQEERGKCPSLFEGSRQLEQGVQLALTHIYGRCSPFRPENLSWTALVEDMLRRDRGRMQFLQSSTSTRLTAASAGVPVQPGSKYGTGCYVATVGVGTPAKNFRVMVDTGSEITWIQCKPCVKCYRQVDPIFDPEKSSSYRVFGCQSSECDELEAMGFRLASTRDCLYTIPYKDESESAGSLSRETLRLGADSLKDLIIGCGHRNIGSFKGTAGILALGMGAFSFPTQTAGKYQECFSYCLPDLADTRSVGWLRFGPSAVPSSEAVYTTLLPNPAAPGHYYVGLSGISVGGQRVVLPTLDQAWTVIDSGSTITYLQAPAYNALKAAFLESTSYLPRATKFSAMDTCFNFSGLGDVDIPSVQLHFSDSATVELDVAGILMAVRRDRSRVCLAFTASPGDLNIIGGFQQQGFRVIYDIPNARIGFAPESCRSP